MLPPGRDFLSDEFLEGPNGFPALLGNLDELSTSFEALPASSNRNLGQVHLFVD